MTLEMRAAIMMNIVVMKMKPDEANDGIRWF